MNHFLDNKRNVFILAFIAIFLESLTSACLKIRISFHRLFRLVHHRGRPAGRLRSHMAADSGTSSSDNSLSAQRYQLYPDFCLGHPDIR